MILVPAYAAAVISFPDIVVGAPGEVLELPFGVFTAHLRLANQRLLPGWRSRPPC
jgi:hypothetical protein